MHSSHTQDKKASQTGPHQPGPPAHTTKQRQFILGLLREAGPTGINKKDFRQGTGPLNGRIVSEPAARIHELEQDGFLIEHRPDDNGFTRFILRGEPLSQPAPPKPKPATQANLEFQRFVAFETGRAR